MDLYTEAIMKLDQLDKAIDEVEKVGERYAEADTNLRVLKAKAKFRLKSEGCAVGILDDGVFIDNEVAEANHEMRLAETLVWTSKERVQAIKRRHDMLKEQLAREYGR